MQYDPLTGKDHTVEVRVLEAIRSNCGESMFPLYVKCSENFLENFNQPENFLPIIDRNINEEWKPWKERYYVYLSKDASRFQIWDKKFAAYGEFDMCKNMSHREHFSFKGIDINKNTPNLWLHGFSLFLDVYGSDTKKVLTLNHTVLTNKGNQEFSTILEELFDIYIDYLVKYLADATNEQLEEIYQAGKFQPYVFWLACNSNQRAIIPKSILQQISVQTTIIKQDKEENYVPSQIPIRDFINSLTEFYYTNLRNFESFIGSKEIDYDAICEGLNQAGVNGLKISGDQMLTEQSHSLWAKTIQILTTNRPLLLYTVTEQSNFLLQVKKDERAILLKGLSNFIPALDYGFHRHGFTAKRYAIPAFEGYDMLAVDKISAGITAPFGPKWYYIIAPFVREEAAQRAKLSKVGFVEQIMSSDTFPNLVDYILHNSIHSEPTAEEIRTAYKQLIEEYYDTMKQTEEDES